MPAPRSALPPMELDTLFQRISAERGRVAMLRQAWAANAAQIADRVGRRYQLAPWIPADVIAITTLYGLDDEAFGAIAEATGEEAMANGGIIEQAQLAELNQMAVDPEAAVGLISWAMQQNPEEWAIIEGEGSNEAGGSPWRFLKRVTENPVAEFAGGVAQGVGGAIPGPVRTGAIGAVRGATIGLQSGYEAVQTAAAGRVRGIGQLGGALLEGDIGGALQAAPAAFGGAQLMPSTYQSTTAGQAVSQLAETGRVTAGTGFFAGDELRQRQAQRAGEVRGLVDGKAWTIGRAVASTVFEPGDSAYGWLSGTIDAAAAVGLDPANYVGAGFAKARAAGTTRIARAADPEWRRAVDEAAGLIHPGTTGVRRTVFTPRAQRFLESRDGRKVVHAFRDEQSPTRIWQAMGKKVAPGDALALARAQTDEDVLRVLAEGFAGGRVRRLPAPGHLPTTDHLGLGITNRLADRWRLFGSLPEGTWLDFDDDAGAVKKLYDVLGNANITGAQRRGLVDNFIEATASGYKGDRYHAVRPVWKAIGEKLEAGGAPPELARRITDGAGSPDRVSDWLTADKLDGIDMDFLGLGPKGGPAMLAEALNSGVSLMDPKDLRWVREQTSGVGRFLNRHSSFTVPKAMGEFYTGVLWKTSVLVRPAYVTRVVGDEVARAMMGGEYRHPTDFLLAIVGHGQGDGLFARIGQRIGGRYGTDLAGDPTNLGRHLNRLDEQIDAAQAAGHTDEVTRLITERTRIADKIGEGYHVDYTQAMIGEARRKSVATALRDDYVAEYQMRTGNILRRTKADPIDEWVDGLSWELGKMHADRITRRVANGGLLAGDDVAKFRPGLDGVEDWIRANTDGVRDELAAMYPGVDWADPANVRQWVDNQRAIVKHFTGDNDEIRQMVATGRLGDKGAYFPQAGKMETAPHVLTRLRAWHAAEDSPEWVRWNQPLFGKNMSGVAQRGKDMRDQLMGWFFGSLYGKTSDYLARNPTFNRFLWKHYEDMAPLLTKDEAAKALAKLDAQKLPRELKASMRAKLRNADGGETLADIDKLARGYALDDTRDLLFDVSKRSQFFDIAKIIFPFGDAWKEFLTTWTQAAYRRPEVVNSLRKVIVGGREGDPDQNGQGFFYRNAYGDEVFAYPLVGRLAEWATGVKVQFEGQLLGMSLGTQVMPGIGPVASVPVSYFLPDTPTWDGVAELLFPYGTPEERGEALNVLPIPGWAQKMGALVPGLRDHFGLDNPQRNLIYANTYMEVAASLAASGEYDLADPQDVNQLDEDARHKARLLSFARGFIQATGPTSPSLTYKVATAGGDVLVTKLAEDFRKIQEEVGYDSAVQTFIDRYGEGVFIYLTGKRRALNPGISPTDEFGKWERTHGHLIDRYASVGAYFGPEGVEFSPEVYHRQVRAGRYEPRTVNERIAEANDIIARSIYFEAKRKIGPDPADNQKVWLAELEETLKAEYPGFILSPEGQVKLREQIAELDRAADDREVQQLPVGDALVAYMDAREEMLKRQRADGVSTSASITSAAGGRYLRDWLRGVGAELAAETPEFKRLWEEVLSREIPEEKEPVVAESVEVGV